MEKLAKDTGRDKGWNGNYSDNISYIFLPFHYVNQENSNSLPEILERNDSWILVTDKMQYMLKYIANKIEGKGTEKRGCFHYTLSDEAMDQRGFSSKVFCMEKHFWHGKETDFPFRILSVQLYSFSTSVNILAFQLHFECDYANDENGENDEPCKLSREQMLWISAAQYHLKKVSREKIHPRRDLSGRSSSFLQIATEIMEQANTGGRFDFFFYVGEGTERANFFTYIEAEFRKNYDYELFYLRRCYQENYCYHEDEKQKEREIFSTAQNIFWGISPEAAICIANSDRDREEFIRTRFLGNYNEQYLFMYILLLHQKYVLYLFLTMIDAEMYEDIEKLEEYRRKLYQFETDFVYSLVTEVPQYQDLYDRTAEVFSLKNMYEDVREPLLSLSEVRRTELEKQQKSRENKTNQALFALSLMGAFSAWIDSYDVIESYFSRFWSENVVHAVQSGCAVLILLVTFYVFIILFGSHRK